MPRFAIDAQRPEPALIERAAERLRAGELVAFPTETVYGLGANALDARAVAKIYAAKGRPSFNPLIVHVHDHSAARPLVRRWPALATRLVERFWPGPLTLVLARDPAIPELVSAGLDTVGLRAPDHPVAQALLRAAGPCAAPSANRYQSISPTTAAHVARSLGPQAWILDGGPTRVGIESTVIDLSDETQAPALLRLGGLPLAQLEALTGPLLRPLAPSGTQARSSPGQVGRHYAPSGELERLARPELLAALAAPQPAPLGLVLLGDELGEGATARAAHHLRLPADPEGYARLLYAALHTLDELGCAKILVEAVPESRAWAAVNDRLERATVVV